MAVFNLYIDTDRSEPVVGVNDSSIAALPPFVQGDSLQLKVWLLSNYSRLSPYDKIPVSGITLQVAIGTKVGSSSTYYTQQFTWTPSADLSQPYFSGTIPMNTVAITNLLASSASAQAWFEVKKVDGGSPVTILAKRITINASVIKDGVDVVPVPLTPLSTEAANASFVKVVHVGYFDVMNVNGKGVRLYCDDDGAFRADPIT